MSFDMKDLREELYNATLITVGATAVGFASMKATGSSLGTPETLKGALKLGVAVGLGCIAVKFLQMKKWIPEEIKA